MRAGLIADLDQDRHRRSEELTARIDEEDAELARMEAQQKERVGELDSAKQDRQAVLVQQDRKYKNRAAQLERMRKSKQELEEVIKRLSIVTKSVPFDPDAPFDAHAGPAGLAGCRAVSRRISALCWAVPTTSRRTGS